MRISSLLIATALLGSSIWAHDERSPYYVQLGIGAVFTEAADNVPVIAGDGEIGFDPGFSGSLALGRRFDLGSRFALDAEIETFYQSFSVDEDDLPNVGPDLEDDGKTLAFMLNGILNWKFTQQYSLYGGVGVGWAKKIEYTAWDSGSTSIPDDDGGAFQGLFGFAYNFGGSYDVRLGYRYFKAEAVDIIDQFGANAGEIDVAQHSVEAGFRWSL